MYVAVGPNIMHFPYPINNESYYVLHGHGGVRCIVIASLVFLALSSNTCCSVGCKV